MLDNIGVLILIDRGEFFLSQKIKNEITNYFTRIGLKYIYFKPILSKNKSIIYDLANAQKFLELNSVYTGILLISYPEFFSYDYQSMTSIAKDKIGFGISVFDFNNRNKGVVVDSQSQSITSFLNKDEGFIDYYQECGSLFLWKDFFSIKKIKKINSEIIDGIINSYCVQPIPIGGKAILHESLFDDLKFLLNLHKQKKPCLFLDRDGVIIEDTGYPHRIEEVKFINGIIHTIKWAKNNNYHVVVLSNQAGLAKGKFTASEYNKFEKYLSDQLNTDGAQVDCWIICPYHNEAIIPKYKKESVYRKPKIAMVLNAMNLLSIDLKKSLMIGDKYSDKLELIDIPTLFIKGRYPLPDNKFVFDSHDSLLTYMTSVTALK